MQKLKTMIHTILICGLILCGGAVWDNVIFVGVNQPTWTQAGTITVDQAALTTDKSYATVAALGTTKAAYVTTTRRGDYIQFRFRTDGAATETNVFHIYAARGISDHYHYVGQFTATTGTQVYSSGIYFGGAVVGASTAWSPTIGVVTQANGIGTVLIDTNGFDRWCVIRGTKGTTATTAYIDYVEF